MGEDDGHYWTVELEQQFNDIFKDEINGKRKHEVLGGSEENRPEPDELS